MPFAGGWEWKAEQEANPVFKLMDIALKRVV
jgi:hypothetical protein